MTKAPHGRTPGWDVPHNYFDPDPPDENEENFDQMVEERMDMHEALIADGEKLRALTGEDHGPQFLICDAPEPLNPTEQKGRPSNCYCTNGVICHPCMTREVLAELRREKP